MRLWSLHPRYLDAKGLTAAWREALLARAVLAGRTRGYRAHPQLVRFATSGEPDSAIAAYLGGLFAEACARGYAFDRTKAPDPGPVHPLLVTAGQVAFELQHLRAKLRLRDPARLRLLPRVGERADLHPLFTQVPGPIADWEAGVEGARDPLRGLRARTL
jgi:hypothetical protein